MVSRYSAPSVACKPACLAVVLYRNSLRLKCSHRSVLRILRAARLFVRRITCIDSDVKSSDCLPSGCFISSCCLDCIDIDTKMQHFTVNINVLKENKKFLDFLLKLTIFCIELWYINNLVCKVCYYSRMNYLQHPFGPLFNEDSRILILGSFPSVRSREQNFFYGHPQNRFWRVIAAVFERPVPQTVEEKKLLILDSGLALWDSIAGCEITGSSDASIRNAKANDISIILDNCSIERIYCNGRKSHELYRRFIKPAVMREAICLPSTSPANAQWSLGRLIEAWSEIRERK